MANQVATTGMCTIAILLLLKFNDLCICHFSFSQDTLEDMVRKEKKEAREDVSEQKELLPMQISSASGNLSIYYPLFSLHA